MTKKTKDTELDANDVNKTVDGVEVYEPHNKHKTVFKPSDVSYGMKKPCLLADGTMPEFEGKVVHYADGE